MAIDNWRKMHAESYTRWGTVPQRVKRNFLTKGGSLHVYNTGQNRDLISIFGQLLLVEEQ